MARPVRIEFAGAIYHVTSRMIGSWRDRRERLFRDNRDYQRFVHRLEQSVTNAGIRLYLFCLMSNNFHLVLETPEGNLSRFMHHLTTAYTIYYNLRHRRHGHLLDGRFKAKLVSGDGYLLRLSRYVHQNPVWVAGWKSKPRKERIVHLHAYPWSSYPSYIGGAKPLSFVDYTPILAMVGSRRGRSRSAYRRYVDSGLAETDQEFQQILNASPCAIGEEGFRLWVERLRAQAMGKRSRKEDVSFRRMVAPLAPTAVLNIVAKAFGAAPEDFAQRRTNSSLRAVAAKCLVRYSGQSQDPRRPSRNGSLFETHAGQPRKGTGGRAQPTHRS